jgi:2-(1,2-epoxy-1,2-dihydrophenyl)acetyl-CoA isomerase
MSYRKLLMERKGDVTVIRLADASTLNAISFEMAEELKDALEVASSNSRAVLLTGEGRGFCSGANLAAGVDPEATAYDCGLPLEKHYNAMMLRIRDLPIPFVTAVNGVAAGGGSGLALSGDIIVAAESAYFLQAFRGIGLVPDFGSAFLLTRAVGRPRAMEMMLLGERIPARQALEWGLVNRVVPDAELADVSLKIATSLAEGPTSALGMIRRLGWAATTDSFEELLALERLLQRDAGRTADHREGIKAFLAKRPAKFTGK